MIYLTHPDGRIAACETEDVAARAEARGFHPISRDLYMAYWRRKDRRAGAAWHAPAPVVALSRTVGEKWRAPWILRDVPKE